MSSDKKPITAHVHETGKSDYAVSILVSGHTIEGDEPEAFGGGNTGPAPYDLLLAALGECTAMTVRWYAKQQNWPLSKVDVRLTHQKLDPKDVPEAKEGKHKVDVFEKQIVVYGEKLTNEQRTKLIEIAAKCPVQRTLQSDVVIRTLT